MALVSDTSQIKKLKSYNINIKTKYIVDGKILERNTDNSHNDDIKNVYKDIESIAGKRLLDMLPDELKEDYKPLFEKKEEDIELWKLVKAADKISALIKCIEEYRMGNREFEKALEAQQKKIEEIDLKEVEYFRKNFLNSYYLTLDEHTK